MPPGVGEAEPVGVEHDPRVAQRGGCQRAAIHRDLRRCVEPRADEPRAHPIPSLRRLSNAVFVTFAVTTARSIPRRPRPRTVNSIELSNRSSVTATRPAAADRDAHGPEHLRVLVRRVVLDHHTLDRVIDGRGAGAIVGEEHDRMLHTCRPAARCSLAGPTVRCPRPRRFDDAAQGLIQPRRRGRRTPGDQEVAQDRPLDVVSENRGAGRAVDVKVRDLVAVRQRDTASPLPLVLVTSAAGRMPRAGSTPTSFDDPQLDAAIERHRRRQDGYDGGRRRASFDVRERAERMALGPDAFTGGTGTDEPSRLIGIAAALDCGLRTGRRRPEERNDSHRAEQDSSSHRIRGNGNGILRSACA